jgi:hypothetical protein
MWSPSATFHSTLAPVDSSADGPAAQSFAILLEAIAEVMALPEIEGRASRAGLVVLAWSLVHGAAALLLDGPLAHGLPELRIEADAVPALVTSTFEALLSARRTRPPLPATGTESSKAQRPKPSPERVGRARREPG